MARAMLRKMKIQLQIETHDLLRLAFDIAGKGNSLSAGTIVDAPGNVRVEFQRTRVHRSLGIPEVLQFVVDISKEVDIALFCTWLYEKIQNKQVTQIVVHRTTITEISEERIRQVLKEEIEIRK
jgi:hypothetical protein